jgi:hypothetical protein
MIVSTGTATMAAMKILSLLRFLIVPCAAMILSGCIEPRTEWAKDGGSADDLRAARQSCEREASGYSFVDDSRYDYASREVPRISSARSDSYRRCMEVQGWRRQRTDQATR